MIQTTHLKQLKNNPILFTEGFRFMVCKDKKWKFHCVRKSIGCQRQKVEAVGKFSLTHSIKLQQAAKVQCLCRQDFGNHSE
jgi:hypothetical protein